jgi:hypothetical protein
MAAILIGGWLDGNLVRTARKPHRCDFYPSARRCNDISVGDRYCEGECNPDNAGGFGQYRYCFECAGYDRETLAHVEKEVA